MESKNSNDKRNRCETTDNHHIPLSKLAGHYFTTCDAEGKSLSTARSYFLALRNNLPPQLLAGGKTPPVYDYDTPRGDISEDPAANGRPESQLLAEHQDRLRQVSGLNLRLAMSLRQMVRVSAGGRRKPGVAALQNPLVLRLPGEGR